MVNSRGDVPTGVPQTFADYGALMRHLLCLGLTLSACAVPQSLPARVASPFDDDLAEIARVYTQWDRMGDVPAWAPTMCTAPPPIAPIPSQSGDTETHGRKLYFLFSKDRSAYFRADGFNQPVGQVLVKESYEAVGISPEESEHDFLLRYDEDHLQQTYEVEPGKRWKLGTPRELFVMMKVDPETPGTDAGWVYGTVTRDGEVTSAGRVASCMECHASAVRDRMFGSKGQHRLATDGYDAWDREEGTESSR